MDWERREVAEGQRTRVRAWGLIALSVILVLLAGGLHLGHDVASRALAQRFGSAARDRAISAEPVVVEGTLMSVDHLGNERSLVSYEYFHGVELFVGYARVPSDATLGWKRLEPLDVELAASEPAASRPLGVILAPRGWITDGWDRLGPWLVLAQIGLAGAVGLGGATLLRRSR